MNEIQGRVEVTLIWHKPDGTTGTFHWPHVEIDGLGTVRVETVQDPTDDDFRAQTRVASAVRQRLSLMVEGALVEDRQTGQVARYEITPA